MKDVSLQISLHSSAIVDVHLIILLTSRITPENRVDSMTIVSDIVAEKLTDPIQTASEDALPFCTSIVDSRLFNWWRMFNTRTIHSRAVENPVSAAFSAGGGNAAN